jgi:DNA-binding transcriptional LysR family regulator
MLDAVSEWVDHDVWEFGGQEGRRLTLEHRPRLACRSVPALLEAVRAGTGVGLLSEQVCAQDFQGRKLVRLLPDWHTAEGTIYLLFTTARGRPPAVGVLIDFLVERFQWETRAGATAEVDCDSSRGPCVDGSNGMVPP